MTRTPHTLRLTLTLGLLVASGLAHAQDQAPQELAPIEATVAELRAAEAEAQAVRMELAALRQELQELRLERMEEHPGLESLGYVDEAGGERVSFGSAVEIEVGDVVDEAVAFGGDVHVRGTVEGDATAFGGSVVVYDSGLVRGEAVSFGGDVRVEGGGRIEGGRVALGVPGVSMIPMAPTPPTPPHPAASALGSVGGFASDAQDFASMLYRRLVLLLSFAGAGVLVVGLMPTRITRVADTLERHPFRSAFVGAMGTGFLGLFSLIFAIITLGLGLPVSVMVVAALGLAWLLGFVGLCQAVGDRLPFEQKPHGRWLAFLVGALLLTCVGSLPLVGWLVVVAASTLGIGAALSSRFGAR